MNASDTYMVNTSISEIRPTDQLVTTGVEVKAKELERTWDTSLLEDLVSAMSITSVLEGLEEDTSDIRLLLESLVNKYIYLLHPLPYYPDLIEWHGRIEPKRLGEILEMLGEDELFEILGKILVYKEEFDEGYIDYVGVEDVCESFRKFAKACGVAKPNIDGNLREKGYRCIVASALLLSKIVFG